MGKIADLLKNNHLDITDEQVQKFEKEFLFLNQQFENTDIDKINTSEYRKHISEKFDKMLVELGYNEFEQEMAEDWLYELYQDGYDSFVSYIVVSYKDVCGEDDLFPSITEAMFEQAERDFGYYDE